MTQSDNSDSKSAASGQSRESDSTIGGNGSSAANGSANHAVNSVNADTEKTLNRPKMAIGVSDPDYVDGSPGKSKSRKRRRKRRRTPASSGDISIGAPADLAVRVQSNLPPQRKISAENVHHGQFGNPHDAYAALDLGTNNCRLLVAVPSKPGQFRVVDAFSRIVRLGEGFGASGRLSEEAMGRAVEALKVCYEKLQSRSIRRSRLIATEAVRSATNGADFLARVKHETGLVLEIADRETEARLAVSGCASLVDRAAKNVLLFDIGGGSSEIALVNTVNYRGGRLADHIQSWTSLPVGVVTMAEKFGGHDVTAETFAEMVRHASDLLSLHGGADLLASATQGSKSVIGDDFHLIGTSGTVTTLAGIHLDLPRYDRRRVDGLWMSAQQVNTINDQLVSWSFAERSANSCIGADRADLVLAGCAILEAIRALWPSDRLRVADRGLREGLLTEMMASDGVWRRRQRGANRYRNRRNDQRHDQ